MTRINLLNYLTVFLLIRKALFVLFVFIATAMFANNITISNVKITGQNTTDAHTLIKFDITWENSWRTSSGASNWDAAWVFIKCRSGSDPWQTAKLNPTGNYAPEGVSIQAGLVNENQTFDNATNPAVGAFVYRDTDGTGTLTATGVKLRWNYGANGISDASNVDIRVYAVEMVYVPEGSFYLGSGGTESGSFTDGTWTSGNSIPLQISSEAALTIGQSAGALWGLNAGDANRGIGTTGTLPADYPKGYGGFYCMKYELTQQQYVDFLNCIPSTAASNRFANKNTNRNAITVSGGVYSTTAPYLANNHMNWTDIGAYLDWSGLRPMTELEFEKAARVTYIPVANEYAWGTATIATNQYTISNVGSNNEAIATNYSSSGNCHYLSTEISQDGPLRVGIFATSTSNRIESGASFYGIMELSGNVWERPISVKTGRGFTGIHGDGSLDGSGNPDVSNWPTASTGNGCGFRGGDFNAAALRLRVSDRDIAAFTYNNRDQSGCRGVRSNPSSSAE